MHFNISLGNYLGRTNSFNLLTIQAISIGDMVRLLRLCFERLGHRVTVNRGYIQRPAVNIIFESFYGSERAEIEEMKRAGYAIGQIWPEPADPLSDVDFSKTAGAADFIWYLFDDIGERCKVVTPNSHLLKFGYVPGYGELGDPRERLYFADFSVTGAATEHRVSVMDSLRSRGLHVIGSNFEPDFIRLSILETCKASLSIQKSPELRIFSLGRIAHAIMNRVPVILEYEGAPTYLSPYVTTAASASFVDTCVTMARSDCAAIAQDAHDRFARELPMVPHMAALIEASLAHL